MCTWVVAAWSTTPVEGSSMVCEGRTVGKLSMSSASILSRSASSNSLANSVTISAEMSQEDSPFFSGGCVKYLRRFESKS